MSDDYDGQVVPGGPSAVRTLDAVTIRKASVGSMDNNAYLLTCRSTGAQLMVDAADDAARLRALLDEGTGRLDVVLTTHSHWDHHRALAELTAQTGARTVAGAADADALPVVPDERLQHGDAVGVGDVSLERIGRLADEDVIDHLTQVRGIGRWTAQMFLIFNLRRLDVWPTGDYGVRAGYARAFGLAAMPDAKELEPLGDELRPYRSLAAWYCWRAADTVTPA